MGFINRIGTFLFTIGVFFITLFVLSDMVGSPDGWLLLGGGALTVLGLVLWWRDPRPAPPPSNRFRVIKEWQKRSQEKPKPKGKK
jgi:hypothetical protein